MFNTNFDITGIHANYLKDLCELRGNVADKDQHSNFKIFKAYIDAYIFYLLAQLIHLVLVHQMEFLKL